MSDNAFGRKNEDTAHSGVNSEADAAGDPSLVVPVIRDETYRRYKPERFSVLHTSLNAGDKYELRLETLAHREVSQRLNLAPGGGLKVVGREVCVELLELASVEVTLQQMTKLRDDLTRAIEGAKPSGPGSSDEQLTDLAAQIAAADIELSRRARQMQEREAPSAELQELTILNARVETLTKQLSLHINKLMAPTMPSDVSPLFETRRRPAPAAAKRGGRRLAQAAGLLLLAGGAGTAVWLSSREAPRVFVLASPSMPARDAAAAPARPPQVAEAETDVQGDNRPGRVAPAPTQAEASFTSNPAEAPGAAMPGTAASPPIKNDLQNAALSVLRGPSITHPEPDPAETAMDTTSLAPVPHVAIRARANTWVRVKDTIGKIYLARVMKPGETWSVPPVAGLELTTGNAGAVSLVVDGAAGEPLGAEGSPMSEKLDQ
jgi:hypothetical protein